MEISHVNADENKFKMDETEQQAGSDRASLIEFDSDTSIKCISEAEATIQLSKKNNNDACSSEAMIEALNTNGTDKESESQSSGDFTKSDLESTRSDESVVKKIKISSEDHLCDISDTKPSGSTEDFGKNLEKCANNETVSEINSSLPDIYKSGSNEVDSKLNNDFVHLDTKKEDISSTELIADVLGNELIKSTEGDKECKKPFLNEIREFSGSLTSCEDHKNVSVEKNEEIDSNVVKEFSNSLEEKKNENESINSSEEITAKNVTISPTGISINQITNKCGSDKTIIEMESKISEISDKTEKFDESKVANVEELSCSNKSDSKNIEVLVKESLEQRPGEEENKAEILNKDKDSLVQEEEEEKNSQDLYDEKFKDKMNVMQEMQSENDFKESDSNKEICSPEVSSLGEHINNEVKDQKEEKKYEEGDSQKSIEIVSIESEKENSDFGEKSDEHECGNSQSVLCRLSASPEQEEENLNKSENEGNEVMDTEMVNCNEIEQIDLSESDSDLKGESRDEEMVADSLETIGEKGSEDQMNESETRDDSRESEKGAVLIDEENTNQPGNSEEETITGDTTNQPSTELVKEKEEEICIIPDDVMPSIPILPQNKEDINERDKSNAGLKTLKASSLESGKPKTRNLDKRSQSTDSKSRPVRNAAKLAGNKIKSLVESDLVFDDPPLSVDLEGKNLVHENTDNSAQMCAQCREMKVCKLLIVQNAVTQYLCSEQCSVAFRTTQVDIEPAENEHPLRGFVRKCAQCHSQIITDDNRLFWETMDFCNEDCLGKYQLELGSNCTNCKQSVPSTSLGKYCVRFGYDIKQFCSALCLEEYKKGLKVCSYCQKDISTGAEGFLAPVGNKGQFKDFCTQSCMEKYDRMSCNKPLPEVTEECAVCSNSKPVQVEVELENKTHKLCSEPCFAAFKFVNNITEGQCDMCRKYFDRAKIPNYSLRLLFYDETLHIFCSKTCMNVYILANRKIVPCNWCKVKKYNFDMIKKVSADGQLSMMCSLNCLMLYQTSVNAVCSSPIKCDFCKKKFVRQPLYHLTMSDATIRNFCSYDCIMSFQNGYPKQKIDVSSDQLNSSITASSSKRLAPKRSQVESTCVPVISSVQSLASPNGPVSPPGRVQISRDVNILPQVPSISMPSSPIPAPPPQVYQQIITKPPPAKQMKNKSVLCKPYSHTKGVSCRPHPCMKETQTDQSLNRKFLIPIPVPIYVPAPMHMFATPFPVPVPFPLPIPVPIFIPTTRNSAKGIMKEIKKIQEKIPTDPFEAELLMMAEMVAGDKKQDPTDSESEEGNDGEDNGDGTFSPENVDTSNTFGDDMLQIALKMASELEEPAVDMESVLTSNTITTSTQPAVDPNKALYASDTDDPDQVNVMAMSRGRKRSVRGSRISSGGTPSKRGRRTSGSADVPLLPPPEPVAPRTIEVEKPDANMCLKYTFGVNAWRHWVMQKNAELEKAAMTNRKIKLFKPELLQLTADELNFSLCLFVKEVRKPNGTEYAPDTIYYLCLGIQQYLFENGRIDNIFTDSYYEKFTDCLDEVAKKFAALYNDSQYIVTRVEEEHLWESKQLGAHSPHVLLSTLMFFNTKHFNLVTVEEHMQLSFSHIMKHWKRNPNTPGVAKIPGSRNVLLRFYPPQSALEANSRKKKVYDQQENEENPLRCPVKLYEFYLSKCPESVKTRNDVFYLLPERSCVPDSPVWYSTMALGKEPLMKMLHRIKMVKEINIALLTS